MRFGQGGVALLGRSFLESNGVCLIEIFEKRMQRRAITVQFCEHFYAGRLAHMNDKLEF